jgi:hypothetical protein
MLRHLLRGADKFESDHPDQPPPPLTRGYGWQAILRQSQDVAGKGTLRRRLSSEALAKEDITRCKTVSPRISPKGLRMAGQPTAN